MKLTITMTTESYLRLVKIYQKNGPLCPELHPDSALGLLSKILYDHTEAAKIVVDDYSPPKFIHVLFPECGIDVMYNTRHLDDSTDDDSSEEDIQTVVENLSRGILCNPIFAKDDIRDYDGPGVIHFPPRECNEGLPLKTLGMVRKAFALLRCDTMTPEIEPESHLSILERWILNKGNIDNGLRLSVTKPVMLNDVVVSHPAVMTALVDGMVIHGLCPDIRFLDETARDIYLSKLIAGTEENNTDGKMLYTTDVKK